MKRVVLVLFAVILVLTSCRSNFVEYPFDEIYDDWSGMEAVIKDFTGEFFGGGDITVNGLFTGCKRLNIIGDMIHCKDDGMTIWYDRTNGSLYRLYFNGQTEQKEKICPYEDCRNNMDGECFHISFYNCMYSDGILYFIYSGQNTIDVEVEYWYNKREMRKKVVSQGVFIYRYDIYNDTLEKLIEFQDITECEMALNGRYMYVQTYALTQSANSSGANPSYIKTDFVITRIDLLDENAVILYSDMANRDDFEKISEMKDFKFMNNKIVMPVNDTNTFGKNKGIINICNMDIKNIAALIELEDEIIKYLYLYENDIYFLTEKWTDDSYKQYLSRVSTESYDRYIKEYIVNPETDKNKKAVLDSNKREILSENISSFCIDENFLYYTITGEIPLYRIKLDYSRELDFYNTFAIYTPKNGEYFNHWDWEVSGNYFYATLNTENDNNSNYTGWRYRIKLNSEQKPYWFYKEY